MKTHLKIIITFPLILLLIIGCSPSPSSNCNTVGTDFQNLYSTTLASNVLFDNYTNMDLVTHEYTFDVNVWICK